MLGWTAEQIGTVILGLSLGIIGLMGGQKGRQVAKGASPRGGDVIEIAGAIVSDKSVSLMVRSLDEFSAASTLLKSAIDKDVAAKVDLTAALRENSRALDRNSETADDIRDAIKDAGSKIERLKDELIRGVSK